MNMAYANCVMKLAVQRKVAKPYRIYCTQPRYYSNYADATIYWNILRMHNAAVLLRYVNLIRIWEATYETGKREF